MSEQEVHNTATNILNSVATDIKALLYCTWIWSDRFSQHETTLCYSMHVAEIHVCSTVTGSDHFSNPKVFLREMHETLKVTYSLCTFNLTGLC